MGRSPQHQGRYRFRLPSRKLAVGVAAAASLVAGCSGGGTPTGGTPVKGGTAVFALPPSATPNYIFPYMSSSDVSDVNTFDLQALLYRPLYWFGQDGQPIVNSSLSLANAPTFNGTKVTIRLKHNMWSNRTPVTAQNVIFWLNMELAEPANYGPYNGFPANVSNIKAVSPTTLTMTMNKPYSPTWFLYNDLSQITPMPAAWDRTASGPSRCTTTVKDCPAVYEYLNAQATNLHSYVGSPLWSIVDGPWKLSAFSADGHLTFVPNKSYSGPMKPKLAAFQEMPFTTDAAEYKALQSPSGNARIDFGYIQQQDAPAKPANAVVGANPLASRGYTLAPWPVWGINYTAVNFQSSVSDHAAIIRQLYFREALAYMMNQAAVLSGPLRGYGNLTVGPVGSAPVTSWLSAKGKQGDPFPYDPGQARSLLASSGWKVVPNGVSTCVTPSLCGPGITKGTGLTFSLPYATGTGWIASEMRQLQSNAARIGIRLNLEPEPLNQVIAAAAGNCKVAKVSCGWDMANWGGDWSFTPDYQPTGEELFLSGAAANSGGYSSATNDTMIRQTMISSDVQALYDWQDYLATQLPEIWQPNADYQLTEIASNLGGATPLSPTLNITPESWYFMK